MKSPLSKKELRVEVNKRITKGRKVLKEFLGEDVLHKIDLENFDINNPRRCILSQIFGCYGEGLDKIARANNVPHTQSIFSDEHGFLEMKGFEEKQILQREWVKRIKAAKASHNKKQEKHHAKGNVTKRSHSSNT